MKNIDQARRLHNVDDARTSPS